MVEIIILLWMLCGVIGHIRQANEMVTYCGKPIWQDVGTYIMFFPAIIIGPFTFLLFERFPRRHPDRDKIDEAD